MILVTGGAGYIGSHINQMLARKDYETIVFDNLVYGHPEAVKWGVLEIGDLADKKRLDGIFKKYKIDGVFHFAAYAYVGESVVKPSKYCNKYPAFAGCDGRAWGEKYCIFFYLCNIWYSRLYANNRGN